VIIVFALMFIAFGGGAVWIISSTSSGSCTATHARRIVHRARPAQRARANRPQRFRAARAHHPAHERLCDLRSQ
jgi:hypothetical protein